MAPYTVALVLDPGFGDRLRDLASRVPTWIVESPQNCAVADSIWASEPKTYSNERGITTFDAKLGFGPEEWCRAMVGTIDQHHDELSRDPGYSVLEVYGLPFNERLRPHFSELGFTSFENTAYGFRALKAEP